MYLEVWNSGDVLERDTKFHSHTIMQYIFDYAAMKLYIYLIPKGHVHKVSMGSQNIKSYPVR